MHLLIALDNSSLNQRISAFLKVFLAELQETPSLSFIHVIDSRTTGIASGYPGVIMNYELAGLSITDEDALISERRKDADEKVQDIQRQLGVTGSVDFPIGNRMEAIEKACVKQKPDLLVIGTHSRKGINHFLFGNFAEEAVRHLHVPLIIISEDR